MATTLTVVFLISSVLNVINASCPSPPPNFPSGIPLSVTNYQNWARQRIVYNLWTATPSSPEDVVTLANWARANNYRLRASGHQHTWAPLTVLNETTQCGNIVLVNTTKSLNQMAMIPDSQMVKVQAGADMNSLLSFLEDRGFGFYNVPAVGDVTVGGALTINGHGTSVPAQGETVPADATFGSLSNLIVSLTAVVWDTEGNNSYILKTFHRSDPESSAFLVHLGRTFLIEVTLLTTKNYNMRCVSRVHFTAEELFADSTTGDTVTKFLDETGRLDVTWFPYTLKPWLKIFSVRPTYPVGSRIVKKPYNYLFQNIIPANLSALALKILNGSWGLAPVFEKAMYASTTAGLISTVTLDLWGPSKNLMLYVAPKTLLMTDSGFLIQTRRNNVQKVLNKFYTFYISLLNSYVDQKKYPTNGPINIRFNALDKALRPDWTQAGISALSAVNSDSTFDIGIWLNFLTLTNTPGNAEFMKQIESFVYENFNNKDSAVRVEWPKGWAFTDEGAWLNSTVLNAVIPDSFQTEWKNTVDVLQKYDPYRIFTNAFLDLLLKK